MDVTIRRAERKDAEAVLNLIVALAHYEKLEPPDDEARARLLRDGWGDRPRYEAWLAELDGRPVGYALAFETYSTFLAQPTLYVEDVFVLPDQRGRGIGRALFTALAKDGLRRECGRMEWACLDWNSLALGFYEQIGARELSEWKYFRLLPDAMERL